MNISGMRATPMPKVYQRRYINTTSRITTIKKPSYVNNKISKTRTNAFQNDMVTMSYFVGKGIVLFTFFYTSLNYFHYKRLREEYEDQSKDDKKTK
jgi:REP element-mobilizing transposase RayT